MLKKLLFLFLLIGVFPSPAVAGVILIDDDFSASSLTNGGLNRDADGWRKGTPQTWMISGGQLRNSGGSSNSNETQRQRENEAAVAQVIDIAALSGLGAEIILSLSFDYTMADSSESLFVHLWGVC